MGPTSDTELGTPTRRAVLGGAADAMAVLPSGCVQRTRSLLNRQSGHPISLTVKTVPADEDRAATQTARLFDKQAMANDVFEGRFRPAAVPIPVIEWTPPDLQWDGEDPEVPFVGTDGELDVAEARACFRDADYQYNDDDLLVSR